MIILLLLLVMLHTGLAVINGYEEVEKNIFTKLGKNVYNIFIIAIIFIQVFIIKMLE